MVKRLAMAAVAVVICLGLASGAANAALIIGTVNKTVVTAANTIAVDQPSAAGLQVDDYLVGNTTGTNPSGIVLNGTINALNKTWSYGNWQGPNGAITSNPVGTYVSGGACQVWADGPTMTWNAGANSSVYSPAGEQFGGGSRTQFSLTADTTVRKLTFITNLSISEYGDGIEGIGITEGFDCKHGGTQIALAQRGTQKYVMVDFTYQWDGVDSPLMYVEASGNFAWGCGGNGYGGFSMIKSESVAVTQDVPEPTTLLLLGTGALGVFGYIRRQRMK